MSVETTTAPQINSINSLYNGQVTLSQYVTDDHVRIVDAYHSTGGFDDGEYLIKYNRESDAHYESRVLMSSYDNIFQPEVDYKILPVYSKPIEREVEGQAKKRVEAFIANVDQQGTSMTGYLKDKMINTELNTSTFFVLTAPKETPKNNNDLRNLPYIINVDPINCSGYYKNNKGQLSILIWPLDIQEDYTTFQVWERTPSGGGVYYLLKVTQEANERTKETQETVTMPQKPFEVKEFPVRMVKLGVEKETFSAPPPKYRSTSKQLVAVFNIRNWVVSNIGDTCFSPILIQTEDGKLPNKLDIGDGNALGYAKDMAAPSRMKVNTEHLDFQESFCDKREMSIRKQMDSYTQINDSSSGEARKEAARKIILYWMNVGETSAELERWIYNTALRNYIKAPYEVMVKYPVDYASLTPDVILDQVERIAATFDITGETKKALFETLIYEVFGAEKERAKSIVDAYSADENGFNNSDMTDTDIEDE